MYNINRRKFLGLFGCTCCSIILPSCSTVPITERKQLSIIPEATINRQAAQAYENFKSKTKLITSGSKLKEIKEIGKKIEFTLLGLFLIIKQKVILLKILVGIIYWWIMIKLLMPGVCREVKLQFILDYLKLQKILMLFQLLWVVNCSYSS